MNIEQLLSIVPKSTIIKNKLDTVEKIKAHVYSHPSIYGLKPEDYPKYYLMNKNNIVAEIITEPDIEDLNYALSNIVGKLPYNCSDINVWLKSRKAATHRDHLLKVMKDCGCDSIEGLIDVTHCANLTDTFWVKHQTSELTWNQVSLYRNNFDENIARIAFDGIGLFGDQFSSLTPEIGTDGMFEKCWVRKSLNPEDIYLYKRGTYGYANAGMEPYSEQLYSQIASKFDCVCTEYKLLKYHDKLTSSCKIFTSEDLSYVPFGYYMPNVQTIRKIIDTYKQFGWFEQFACMIVLDALTVNTDRHLGNFGIMVNSTTLEPVSPSPLFDFNLSCLPYVMEQDDYWDYYKKNCEPKLGKDFVTIAQGVLTSKLRTELINLKNFDYEDPGFGFPKWRLDMLNDIKDQQIKDILA